MKNTQHILVGLSGSQADIGLIRYAAMLSGLARLREPGQLVQSVQAVQEGQAAAAATSLTAVQALAKSGTLRNGHSSDLGADAEVRFVHVLPQSEDTLLPKELRRLRKDLRGSVRAYFRGNAEVTVECDVLKGQPTARLLDYAAEQECDLLLVGQKLADASRRVLARKLTMNAPCSVWVVPEEAAPVIRRILVPVDFSGPSADSLRAALTLARQSGQARCLALHVYFNDSLVNSPEQDRALRREKEKEFARFMEPIQCDGITVEPLFVEGAKISHVISRVAEKEAVDLIVMATRGRNWAAGLVLGSVTESTIARIGVPLLAIKHFGARLGFFQALFDKKLKQQSSVRFN